MGYIEGDSSDSSSILDHTVTMTFYRRVHLERYPQGNVNSGRPQRCPREDMLNQACLLRADQPRPDITRNKGVRPKFIARVGKQDMK